MRFVIETDLMALNASIGNHILQKINVRHCIGPGLDEGFFEFVAFVASGTVPRTKALWGRIGQSGTARKIVTGSFFREL